MSEQRGMGAVLKHFAHVEDPRMVRARVHSLVAILTIALCGVICGAESWVEIAEFGCAKADWFATFLDLPSGIPSHDTFGRVFARLDAAQFEAGFAAWMEAVAAQLPLHPLEEPTIQAVVALDGKTLRRSHDRGAGKLALPCGERVGPRQPLGPGATRGAREVQRDHRLPATPAPVGPRGLSRDH